MKTKHDIMSYSEEVDHPCAKDSAYFEDRVDATYLIQEDRGNIIMLRTVLRYRRDLDQLSDIRRQRRELYSPLPYRFPNQVSQILHLSQQV